jgi:predicted XRE-type DNA-binding protein
MNKTYKNVFEALEDDPAVAKNLFIRSRLMIEIREYIRKNKLTQKEASIKTGVTQPRISDLMRGKIDLFTIDTLVSMLEKLGIDVDVTLTRAA